MARIIDRVRTWLVVGVTYGMAATPAFAGRITAELDHTEGGLDDTFVLTVSMEGSLEGDLAAPEVPGLVFAQQGHSERMTISNGHRVSEVSIMYAVRAQQAGEFQIPSMTANLDGENVASLPLTLKVLGGGGSGNQAPQAKGPAPKDVKGDQDTGGVFIERECSNLSPYVGEQVVCTARIYHRGNLNGGQRPGVSSADFRRFSVQGEQSYQKLVNGQRYAVIELRDIIVPTKAGALELAPFVLEGRVLTWTKRGNPLEKFMGRFGGGMFNFDMNFTEEKQVTIKSEPTPFDVKPLPEAGMPPNFNGLVGQFALSASLGRSPVTTGDTTTVTVTLTGEGLLDMVGDPPLALQPIGKVYPDKPEYKETIAPDAGVRSSKTFRYALVPDKAGSFPLGNVEVPSFNPKLGQYVVLSADLGTLKVEQGDVKEQPLAVGQSTDPNNKNSVQVVGTDLLDPHKNDLLESQQTITKSFLIKTSLFALSPWLFSFSFMGLQGYRKRRDEQSGETRRARAFRTYRTGMDEVTGLLQQGKTEEGVVAAHKAFRELVGAKANRHGAAFTTRELEEHLTSLGASDSIRTEAGRIIALLEQSEFGGQRLTDEAAKALIRDLDGVACAMETLC